MSKNFDVAVARADALEGEAHARPPSSGAQTVV